MIQDIMPGTEELLAKEMVSGYIGFDPPPISQIVVRLIDSLIKFRGEQNKIDDTALEQGVQGSQFWITAALQN